MVKSFTTNVSFWIIAVVVADYTEEIRTRSVQTRFTRSGYLTNYEYVLVFYNCSYSLLSIRISTWFLPAPANFIQFIRPSVIGVKQWTQDKSLVWNSIRQRRLWKLYAPDPVAWTVGVDTFWLIVDTTIGKDVSMVGELEGISSESKTSLWSKKFFKRWIRKINGKYQYLVSWCVSWMTLQYSYGLLSDTMRIVDISNVTDKKCDLLWYISYLAFVLDHRMWLAFKDGVMSVYHFIKCPETERELVVSRFFGDATHALWHKWHGLCNRLLKPGRDHFFLFYVT